MSGDDWVAAIAVVPPLLQGGLFILIVGRPWHHRTRRRTGTTNYDTAALETNPSTLIIELQPLQHFLNILSTIVDLLRLIVIVTTIALPDFSGNLDLSTLDSIAATLRGIIGSHFDLSTLDA